MQQRALPRALCACEYREIDVAYNGAVFKPSGVLAPVVFVFLAERFAGMEPMSCA